MQPESLNTSSWPSFNDWGDQRLLDIPHILSSLDKNKANNSLDLTQPMIARAHISESGQTSENTTHISPAALMTLYRLPVPTKVSQLAQMVDGIRLAMEGLLRQLYRTTTYMEELLTGQDIEIIKAQIALFRDDGSESLFDQLAASVLQDWNQDMLRQYPASAMLLVLQTPEATELGQQLLRALGWYGGQAMEKSAAITTALLLEKACALDADPEADLKGFAFEAAQGSRRVSTTGCGPCSKDMTVVTTLHWISILCPIFPSYSRLHSKPGGKVRSRHWIRLFAHC